MKKHSGDAVSSLLAVGVIILLVLLVAVNPMTIVGVGERGVKVTLGKTSPQSYSEGVHFVTPFVSRIHKLNVKTQKSNIITEAQTKDIQVAKITYVVNYNLDPNSVHKMFKEVGKEYKDIIVYPIVQGIVKDVIGKWNAQDLIANRENAASEIKSKLTEALAKKYITVTDFSITDIQYSQVFMNAIENKVTAEQEALQAKNKTVQVQEEAKQKLISAEAEAKSMAIRANALTQNKALINYEIAKKWDGHLPQYMTGNSMPLLNFQN